MHRRERHPKIDGFLSITVSLIVEADSARLDEDVAEIVAVGYVIAVQGVVEYALPFVGQLIFVVEDNFFLVWATMSFIRLMFGPNGLGHFGEKAEGGSGIGRPIVSNVEGRRSDTERTK